MLRPSTIRLLGAFAAGVAFLGILVAVRARAAGVPEADGMTYTGYLESAEGTPLTGEHSIAVQFWESEEAADDLCTGKLDAYELQSGRFQVPLPLSCSDAVKASPDVWVSVDVDGASLGRTKLGAVPYALEAGHTPLADQATNADEAAHAAVAADADGDLDDRLSALETATTKSAFLALNTTGTSIAHNTAPTVVFDSETFDVGAEHNATTGVFTPKTAGYYDISCNIVFFNSPTASKYYLEAGIFIDGTRRDVAAGTGDGYVQTYRARSMLKLAAGDEVTCHAYQNSGAAMPLAPVRGNEAVSSFSAFRLSP